MEKESTDQGQDTRSSDKPKGCFPFIPHITLGPDDPKSQEIRKLVGKYRGKVGVTIPILQDIQEIYGYIPAIAVDFISQELGIPTSVIYGIVTFYAQFHTEPRGKNVICACRGTACHVKGGKAVLKAIQDRLGIGEGETTEDLTFTLETVACLGACALAPVVIINRNYYGNMNPQKIITILKKYEEG